MQIDLLDQQLAAGLRGEFDDAWRIAQILEKDRPNDDRAAFNRGWYVMRNGDLHGGFALLERGRRAEVFGSRPLRGVRWDGAAEIQGKTILLRSEGGLGDELINFRFAQDIASRGAKVVLSCHPALMSIARRVEGVTAVVSNAEADYTLYDYFVPAMSAAYTLGLGYEELSGKSYITPDKANSARWREKIATRTKSDTLKVGIRWSGNPKFEHEQHRRFPPEPLIALSDLPGVTVFSLQRDNDLRDLPSDVIDLDRELVTWEDTLAALSSLDLVITSCTSVAHAAAALGKETWIILPVLPYYIWAYPGDTSPWYETARLFRQETFGVWDAPLSRVRASLQAKVATRRLSKVSSAQNSSEPAPAAQASTAAPVRVEKESEIPYMPGHHVGSWEQASERTPGYEDDARFLPSKNVTPLKGEQSQAPAASTDIIPHHGDNPYIPKVGHLGPVPNLYAAPHPSPRPRKKQSDATLHFVAGLPRSGSTALVSLMTQNPRIFSAPISGLCGMFSGIYANWDKDDFHREYPNRAAKVRVLRGILDTYHETDRPVILDKDRGWVSRIAMLEAVLERPVKVLLPVRPLAEVLASFEALRRQDPLELTGADADQGAGSTIATRAQYFAGPGGPLGMAYNGMKDAVTLGYLDRLLFVDYGKLTSSPKRELARIHDFLGEPSFEYDVNNVRQVQSGDGRTHRFPGLHDVRSTFSKDPKSARLILGDVYGQYDQPEPWAGWI